VPVARRHGLSAGAQGRGRSLHDLLRPRGLSPPAGDQASAMGQWPHRFQRLALSDGDQAHRRGDEQDRGRRRHDVPQGPVAGFRRRRPGRLQVHPQGARAESGMAQGSERQSVGSVQPRGGDRAVTTSASTTAMAAARSAARDEARRAGRRRRLRAVIDPLIGIAVLLALWWFGGYLIAANPETASFAGFGPGPALGRLVDLIADGELWSTAAPSLHRILGGLACAIAVGVPVGVAIGSVPRVRSIAHVPFQFLRMISPLSWMPIAILAFATWDGAIVFLIFAASVWPIIFSTAHGISRIDPSWFKVARNLGARGRQLLQAII